MYRYGRGITGLVTGKSGLVKTMAVTRDLLSRMILFFKPSASGTEYYLNRDNQGK